MPNGTFFLTIHTWFMSLVDQDARKTLPEKKTDAEWSGPNP